VTPLGRREFLLSLARASAGAAALSSIPAWARHAIAKETGPPIELIERNRWPEHWETTVEGLGHSWITRNDRFFVRTHFPVPPVDPATWRLEVSGLVGKPLTLSLDAIRALRQNEAVHTLECAGNGRGLFQLPSTSGTQWEYGAVGNASWGGVRLATLLDAAEVKPEAKHVWFEAADHATLPQAPPFLRSIPIEKAMADTLLAHRMNGEPLPSLHGAPLRAIVPGWYGMASTKWVTRVRLEAEPSDNHFMVKGYRYVEAGMDPTQAPPVREIKVKSLIMRPGDGGRVPLGFVRVQGFAWAGPSGVRRVDVSRDDGKTWTPAGFMGENAPMAWRSWATEFEIKSPARLTVMARATDNAGAVQPLAAAPNAAGYGNNSIHQVSFRVG
jgi:DMSO/TMAO reductase YedYZ molybdopterin-dependent catalytic subunit